jgi:hypothetical protein
MEATERRLDGAVRMPVDLLVQLSHEGDDEAFDADAVNLSATGLALRSAVLPDIGQRLRCRFEVPDDGSVCETDAEVVWASDAGAHTGEFGVKFTAYHDGALEPRVREMLDSWVTTLEGNPPRVITPVSTMAPDAWGRSVGRAVRVQIDGVASPFDGAIRADRGNNIAIEQPLPFLKIGRGTTLEVGDRSERRTLANVELVIDGDVPRLVLTLAKLSARATTKSAPPDMRSPEPRVARSSDTTMQDDSLEPSPLEADAGYEPEAEVVEARATDSSAGREWVTSDVETPSSIDTGLAAREAEPARDDDYSIDEAPVRAARDVGRMREREPARAMKIEKDDGEALAPVETGPGARERLLELKARAAPTLVAMVAKMRAAWTITIATTGPWTKRAIAWLAKTARAVAEQVRARAPERIGSWLGKAPKRRTTAAPPAPTPGLRKGRGTEPAVAPEVVSPMRGKGRLVLAALVAVFAVGFTAYAFAGTEEPVVEAPIEVHRAPVVETPEPVVAEAAPLTAIESGEEIPTAAASAPEPSGGHLPPPTFPSLASASSSSATTDALTAPTDTSAAPVVEPGSATEFGAASVTGGRLTTLHMSQPVTSIVGQADESGFTVTIHGALSLDRAGPIAAANPSVERASIINRGDHSVLTIRFVAGRSPAYRVAVHGQAVEVTIGR